MPESDLFWVAAGYTDAAGNKHSMGGLMGELTLPDGAITAEDWPLWVLGQYLGIGQRRAFGWGRYLLEDAEGRATLLLLARASPLSRVVAEPDNLERAYRAIRENLEGEARERYPLPEDLMDEEATDRFDRDERLPESYAAPIERLDRIARELGEGRYAPALLYGSVLHRPDGQYRPLAVPPFWDRVAQRAVAQVLGECLDPLLHKGSFGYRPGISRVQARLAAEAAYLEGYRWVFESDIDDFFDSVDWRHLAHRLRALWRDDPLVALVLRWAAAPVWYAGETLSRDQGLPQGSPLSPWLANLLLDDFDHDVEDAGFRMLRFADDFIVLCRDRKEAETAGQAVRDSLAALGLSLNPEKTRIGSFAQGFRYLGYLFVNGLTLESPNRAQVEPANPALPPEQAEHPGVPPRSWLARAVARGIQPLAGPEAKAPAPEGTVKATQSRGTVEPSATATGPAAERAQETRLVIASTDPERTTLVLAGAPLLLRTENGQLVAQREETELARQPWRHLGAVVLFGPHQVSTPALRAAMRAGVPIHFATAGGHYQGLAWNGRPGAGWELWLAQQQAFTDPKRALVVARPLVEARLRHQRELLRQRRPDFPNPERAKSAIEALGALIQRITSCADRDTLNGIEGRGAAIYFDRWRDLIAPEWGFDGRARRPPPDPVNALLSLGYTLLYAHADTLLRAEGLLPWLGAYHQPHGRHAALASDLIEPFRHLVERTTLSALGRLTLHPTDFQRHSSDGCRLHPEPRRRYLALLARRFHTPVTAVGETEARDALGHLLAQARRLAAWLRGTSAEFTAFRQR